MKASLLLISAVVLGTGGLAPVAAQASGYSVIAQTSAAAGNVYSNGRGNCRYGVNGQGGVCATGGGGSSSATITPLGGDTSARSVTSTVSGSGAGASAFSRVTADLATASIHLYGSDSGQTGNGSSQSTPYGYTNESASLFDTLHFTAQGAGADTMTTITGIFTLEGTMRAVGGNVDTPNSAYGELYGALNFGGTPSRFDLKNNVDTGFVTTADLDNYPSGITPSTWTTNADHTVNVSTFNYSFMGASSDVAFNLNANLNCGNGFICDFGNTAKFALSLPTGTRFTSDSGVFLSGAGTGGGVPEPASWGLMLIGFAGLGAVMRRRRAVAGVAAV